MSWLQGNERVADFFLENSEIINYNVNDILISRGECLTTRRGGGEVQTLKF